MNDKRYKCPNCGRECDKDKCDCGTICEEICPGCNNVMSRCICAPQDEL